MAKFVCEHCNIEQDVPLVGWHYVGKEPGTQHFKPCGEAIPDPNDPLKLTCPLGHDHKLLMPIHWECGNVFKYVKD
nr:hypothetical protein [Desulfobacterales bacterium]